MRRMPRSSIEDARCDRVRLLDRDLRILKALVASMAMRWAVTLTACVLVTGSASGATPAPVEHPVLPEIRPLPLPQTPTSHPFAAARFQSRPLDLAKYGYTEEEYLLSGVARVFDWNAQGVQSLASGPYTTRILVRRPIDGRRASGTVIVEPMNPSVDIDLPIMWAESYRQFMAKGDVWVGVTIKPNTIEALRAFDPVRYAKVSMPNPREAPGCAVGDINPWSQPTTPGGRDGACVGHPR